MPTIRIKSGTTTPTSSDVVDAELAFDRTNSKLYIGSGTAGGAASSVVEVGGEGKADAGAIISSGLTMGQDRILARTEAGTGAVEEFGLSSPVAFSGKFLTVDIANATEKAAAAVDADELLIADSADSNAVKKISRANLISGLGGGSVTSVALTAPSIFSVTGSPVTTSGTLDFALATQTANAVFAGPSTGADAAPTFRALVSDDLPDIDGGTF